MNKKYQKTKGNTTTVSAIAGRKADITVLSIAPRMGGVTIELTGEQGLQLAQDIITLLLANNDMLLTDHFLTLRIESERSKVHFLARKKANGQP